MARGAVLVAWLLLFVRLSFALEPVGTSAYSLINNSTSGSIKLNGLWYVLSNSTTDWAKMDSLTDPKACTRDAALMTQLGINVIYADAIDPTANHDDCFSIFNSVGIYVVVLLNGNLFVGPGSVSEDYSLERVKDMFKWFDAVKDYENLLAVDIGVFPDESSIELTRYAEAQKTYRAMIRDMKEYVERNSPRPILVGGTLNQWLDRGNLTMTGPLDYLTCIIEKEDHSSRADFVSFQDYNYYEYDATELIRKEYQKLNGALVNTSVPVWLSGYATAAQNGESRFEVFNETLQETNMLYNETEGLTVPYGMFSGGVRFEWTNVRLNQLTSSNWGITTIDADGNIQLTKSFETLKSIFSQYNTESWLNGDAPIQSNLDPPDCKPEIIVNVTSVIGESSTVSLATEWDLPTRPAGLDDLITSGASGTRGQMVDVTMTTIAYKIKDSKGSAITEVVLSPSKSEHRTTTKNTAAPSTTHPSESASSTPLTTGAKAGIGVGSVIGVAALVGLGFLVFRWRKRRSAVAVGEDEETNEKRANESTNGFQKAELPAGSNVDPRPVSELPAGSARSPDEVPGDGIAVAKSYNGPPVELPVTENAQELPPVQTPTAR